MNLLFPDAIPALIDWLVAYFLVSFILVTVIQACGQRGMAWVVDRAIRSGLLSFLAAMAMMLLFTPGMLAHCYLSSLIEPDSE